MTIRWEPAELQAVARRLRRISGDLVDRRSRVDSASSAVVGRSDYPHAGEVAAARSSALRALQGAAQFVDQVASSVNRMVGRMVRVERGYTRVPSHWYDSGWWTSGTVGVGGANTFRHPYGWLPGHRPGVRSSVGIRSGMPVSMISPFDSPLYTSQLALPRAEWVRTPSGAWIRQTTFQRPSMHTAAGLDDARAGAQAFGYKPNVPLRNLGHGLNVVGVAIDTSIMLDSNRAEDERWLAGGQVAWTGASYVHPAGAAGSVGWGYGRWLNTQDAGEQLGRGMFDAGPVRWYDPADLAVHGVNRAAGVANYGFMKGGEFMGKGAWAAWSNKGKLKFW